MKRRRSRQGPPAAQPEPLPDVGQGAGEAPEAAAERERLRSAVWSLEDDLAAVTEAHEAERERAERAEARVAETRTQAEEWVAESRTFMEQRVAAAEERVREALAGADSEQRERLAAEERLRAVVQMEADAQLVREEHRQAAEAARAELGTATAEARETVEQITSELGRERALRADLERRLEEAVAQPLPEPGPDHEPVDEVPVDEEPEDGPAPPAPERARLTAREPLTPPIPTMDGDGGCAVCHRTHERDEAELIGDGWAVEGEERLCPRCREAGWQLAPGADAPFRPYSDRRVSGRAGPASQG